MTQITHNLASVRRRIVAAARHYGRNPDSIRLLAVSKKQPVSAICEAIGQEQKDFGESFVVEAIDKQSQIDARVTWHFIGKIQSNKARLVARHFDWVHSLDRIKIAHRLSRFRGAGKPLKVLIELNLSDDPSRAGVAPAELHDLAAEVRELPNLRLRGLMSMAPYSDDEQVQRAAFRRTRGLFDDLNADGFNLDCLSMGMSGDLEAAIAEGANWVRVGSDIFGARSSD
ncbi:MAG: YggS family pyridoxal phosphate-dependent enzyme [Gammaproteobacteria bacterium]|nr:YggS family pyridoxal phosphate-dependent enzyme [Gammaproteobacteria bacterium]